MKPTSILINVSRPSLYQPTFRYLSMQAAHDEAHLDSDQRQPRRPHRWVLGEVWVLQTLACIGSHSQPQRQTSYACHACWDAWLRNPAVQGAHVLILAPPAHKHDADLHCSHCSTSSCTDTNALIVALEQNTIAAVGMDV